MGSIIIEGFPEPEPGAAPWPQDDSPDAVRTDELFAARLDNELADELHALQSDLAGKRGDDALAAIGQLGPAIAGLKKRYLGQALGPRQKSLVERLIDARIEQTGRFAGGLARRATLELDDQVTAERLAGFRRDAALAWDDPQQLRLYGRATVQELRYQGERRGWDTVETDAKVRGGLSELYAGAVQAAIEHDLSGAETLYEHARDAIAGERQAELDRRFQFAREDKIVGDIDRTLSTALLDSDRPPTEEMMATLAERLMPQDASPEVRHRVAASLKSVQGRLEREWRRQEAAAGAAALEWMNANPGASAALLPWQVRRWLAPDQRQALENFAVKGRIVTDRDVFERLDRQMIYEPATFTSSNLERYRLSLDDAAFTRFDNMQRALQEGAMPPILARYKFARTTADEMLSAAGLHMSDERAARIGSNIRDALEQFETLEGREPARADVAGVAVSAISQEVIGNRFAIVPVNARTEAGKEDEDIVRVNSPENSGRAIGDRGPVAQSGPTDADIEVDLDRHRKAKENDMTVWLYTLGGGALGTAFAGGLGTVVGGIGGRLVGHMINDALDPNPPPPPKGSASPTNADKTMPGAP